MIPSGLWRTRAILLLVLVSAFAFRLVLFFSGLVDVMYSTADSWQYEEEARSILHSGTFSEFGIPSMFRTPGYPGLLALIYGTLGASQAAVTGVQMLLDAVTCVLVTHMALRLGLSRVAVALVVLLCVTCVFTSVYTFQVMTETVYTLALTLSVWLWYAPSETSEAAGTTPPRALLSGLAMGYAILVRPAILASALLFGLGICAIVVVRIGWRMVRLRHALTPLAFALGVAVCIVPWMIRNQLVFRSEYQKPDNQDVTLLGFKSPIVNHRHYYVREFNRFLASYEQPYVALRPDEPPVIAKYVYPEEEAEVTAAFANLALDLRAWGTHQPESMPPFERIMQKRYRAAPRLHLTAPATLIAKIWISPRISVLWKDRSGHNSGTGLIVGMTAYSSLYLIGFLGIVCGLWKRVSVWAIFIATMVVGHTLVYALWMPLPQARYAVVLYPLLALGIGVFVQHCQKLRFASLSLRTRSTA